MKVYIFDMDGTFINSMDYWNNLMVNYLTSKELSPYDGIHTDILSLTLDDGVNYVKERYNLDSSVEDMIGEMRGLMAHQYENVFELDSDAREIFDELKARGDKVVLATTTERSLVDIVLKRFNLENYFDLEVVSDEVSLHKNSPQYFLDIANYFKVGPKDCIVFEDSLYAIKSSLEAGMEVVGITAQAVENHLDDIRRLSVISGKDLGEVKNFILSK